jgi:AcrR family transcriptional regulator
MRQTSNATATLRGVPPVKQRRTQEERRAETRRKLLEATVKSVLEFGYANTTTRRVAELAGVSAGAEAHYFPRRAHLFAAAVEHLAEVRIEETRRRVGQLPEKGEERLEALLDLLWEDFSSPIFVVFVKLWVAAADEPELYQQLAVAERRIARAITALGLELVGELADQPRVEDFVVLALSACRGLALTEHFEPRDVKRRRQWRTLKPGLLRAIKAAPPP